MVADLLVDPEYASMALQAQKVPSPEFLNGRIAELDERVKSLELLLPRLKEQALSKAEHRSSIQADEIVDNVGIG